MTYHYKGIYVFASSKRQARQVLRRSLGIIAPLCLIEPFEEPADASADEPLLVWTKLPVQDRVPHPALDLCRRQRGGA